MIMMEAIDVSDITLVLPTDGFIVWPDLPSFSGPYSLPPAGKQEKVDIAEGKYIAKPCLYWSDLLFGFLR